MSLTRALAMPGLLLWTLWLLPVTAQPPALPEGLGTLKSESRNKSDAPALPEGLDDDLGETDSERSRTDSATILPGDLTGFWDTRAGVRLRDDPHQRDTALAETRLQLSYQQTTGRATFRITGDLIHDDVADSQRIRFERGQGWFDLREAFVDTRLGENLDLRAGRQILTWGVGDLVFLNDLFPKDWNSFFVGRDVEYLKAPSDAFRLSGYTPFANVDLVYTPRFDADRFLDNQRLSFFDPLANDIIGGNVTLDPARPNDWFDDDEWALRIYRTIKSWEVAVYGYHGFWKSPRGFDPVAGRPTFPRLRSWGASVRGRVHTGIFSAETAWYDSMDDSKGTDPLVPNSQVRLLIAYEQELVRNLTLGLQYYLERTLDRDELKSTLPVSLPEPDRNRHLLTSRLTLLTHSQTVTWSLFGFMSPSDEDLYIRGLWSWKYTDAWTIEAGFNWFDGRDDHTFFGQAETNSNAYVGIRYGF
ncbi:MAG: DUF1302 family protein [Pseudomonadales bacterium]